MYYAIAPNGDVFSYKRVAQATDAATELKGWVGSDATDTDTGLTNVPSPLLVTLHNLIRPEKPVTRFSDRATGEKRLKGVLEVLAKPGEIVTPPETVEQEGEGQEGSADVSEEVEEEFTPNPSLSDEENEMARTAHAAKKAARKSGRKSAAKKSAAKKTGAKRAARAEQSNITDATVRKVIKQRADGLGWPEILKGLGEKPAFVHRIRPLMKAMDKSSVKKMGPGSPNYGKGGKKK